MGRPSSYTEDTALAICTLVAMGKPLTRICRESEHLPDLTTIYRWMQQYPEFCKMYARAKEDCADTLADEIQEIADDGSNDTYIDEDGNQNTNHDVIQRSRLRVDARKWIAAKLKPRKYGDKIQQEHTGADGKSMTFTVITGVPSPDGEHA